jgi:hypothetical protein
MTVGRSPGPGTFRINMRYIRREADMPYSPSLEFIFHRYSNPIELDRRKAAKIELASQLVEALALSHECLRRSKEALELPVPRLWPSVSTVETDARKNKTDDCSS